MILKVQQAINHIDQKFFIETIVIFFYNRLDNFLVGEK